MFSLGGFAPLRLPVIILSFKGEGEAYGLKGLRPFKLPVTNNLFIFADYIPYLLSFSPEVQAQVFPSPVRQHHHYIALIHLISDLNGLVDHCPRG